MKEIILVGSGGCMQELLWQIEELNKQVHVWNVLGYVDVEPNNSIIDVGNGPCPYLGTDDYLLNEQRDRDVAICIGEPLCRKKVAEKLKQNPRLHFPPVVLSETKICPNVELQEGCIISMHTVLSTEVSIGAFAFLNMGVTVCHQGKIGMYTTLSPYVKLAGNVTIGEICNLGMGTQVIQGVIIGNQVISGAGSVIIEDTKSNCTVVGIPAKTVQK